MTAVETATLTDFDAQTTGCHKHTHRHTNIMSEEW